MDDIGDLASTLDDVIVGRLTEGRLREFLELCVESLYDENLEGPNRLIETMSEYDHTPLTEQYKDEIGKYLIRETEIESLRSSLKRLPLH